MDTQHLLAFLVCPDGRAEALEGQPEGSRLLAKGHTRKEAHDERGMGARRSAGTDRTAGRASRNGAEEAAVSSHGSAPHQDISRQLVVARRGAEDREGANRNEGDSGEPLQDSAHDLGLLLLVSAAATCRQADLSGIDTLEVIDQRLDRQHTRVRTITRRDLSWQRLGDTSRLSDRFPFSGRDRAEPVDKWLKEGAHAPFFPVCGNPSIRLREKIQMRLPITRKNNMKMARRCSPPPYEEELDTMTSPPAREVLANNLAALKKTHKQYGTLLALERATSTRGGTKIGKTTIANILAASTPVNLDYVEVLAKVFGLAPWQMLVPELNPENPQILKIMNQEEAELWERVRALSTAVAKLDHEKAEDTIPARAVTTIKDARTPSMPTKIAGAKK